MTAFDEALRIDPKHSLSWGRLCHVYGELGDRAKFQLALIRLRELDPQEAKKVEAFRYMTPAKVRS